MAQNDQDAAGSQPRKEQAGRGKTQSQAEQDSVPSLPHERDESTASQHNDREAPPEVGKRALKDLQEGQVDTDRGPVLEETYERKVKR